MLIDGSDSILRLPDEEKLAMTEWFNKEAGHDFSIGKDDPSMLLVGDQTPDWVRLPDSLGGDKLKVLAVNRLECPMCQDGAPIKHLACSDGYGVAECNRHGFVWYRMREGVSP